MGIWAGRVLETHRVVPRFQEVHCLQWRAVGLAGSVLLRGEEGKGYLMRMARWLPRCQSLHANPFSSAPGPAPAKMPAPWLAGSNSSNGMGLTVHLPAPAEPGPINRLGLHPQVTPSAQSLLFSPRGWVNQHLQKPLAGLQGRQVEQHFQMWGVSAADAARQGDESQNSGRNLLH